VTDKAGRRNQIKAVAEDGHHVLNTLIFPHQSGPSNQTIIGTEAAQNHIAPVELFSQRPITKSQHKQPASRLSEKERSST
jgi:hypothetical protein